MAATRVVTFRCSDEEKERLEAAADLLHRPMSQVLREGIVLMEQEARMIAELKRRGYDRLTGRMRDAMPT